jgi:adenosylhomocysteine nucleosidase
MWLVCVALAEELPDELPTGYTKVITGVGKVNASIALAEALSNNDSVEGVINYGSAGGFQADHKGQLLSVSAVLERDMDCTGLGLSPYVTFGEKEALIATANGAGVVCGTGDSFGPQAADYDIVEMEAYALAKVCAAHNLAFHCYKYISDISSDEDAHEQWQENVHRGAEAFMQLLETSPWLN